LDCYLLLEHLSAHYYLQSITQARMLSVGVIVDLSLGCNLFFCLISVLNASLVVQFDHFVFYAQYVEGAYLSFNLVVPFVDGAVLWLTLPSPLLPWLILLPLPTPRHCIFPILVACISNPSFHQFALSYQVV
jgi:hypothetical protein